MMSAASVDRDPELQDPFADTLSRLTGHLGEVLSVTDPFDTVWGRYPYYHQASEDASHHYALGVGDLNPRWQRPPEADAGQAHARPAIPSIVFGLGAGGLSGSIFSRLPLGEDNWETWGGAEITWERDLLIGEDIVATSVFEDVQPIRGRSGDMLKLTARTEFCSDGVPVSTARTWVFLRAGRAGAGSARSSRTLRDWSRQELTEVRDAKRRYRRRGSRSWHEGLPAVGDRTTMLKGPLTSSMIVSFVSAWQGQILGGGDADLEMLDTWPDGELGIPQEPHVAGHYSDWHAKGMGLPGIYDCGPQRVSWAIQLVTDWAGDFALLRRLSMEVRDFNFVGDLQTLACVVTRCRPNDSGSYSVDLDLDVRNQNDVQTARGTATVEIHLD